MSLTQAEELFFQTGDVSHLQPAPPAAPAAPAFDPVANAGVSSEPPVAPPQEQPPAIEPQVPAAQQSIEPPASQSDVAEILRRSLAESQQRAAVLEAQLRGVVQQQQPKFEPIDPQTDPIGALLQQQQMANARIAQLQAQLVGQQQQQQQVGQLQAFQDQVKSLTAEFSKTAPDFDQAYQHLRNIKMADYRALGLNEQAIQQRITIEEFGLAESAILQAKNPAQVVYEMSQRYGYKPTAVPPQSGQQAPTAKLDQIAQAQAAARTLASQPSPNTDVSVESLKAASDADLNKMVQDPSLWGKIAGRNDYPL